jgi:hypothetical protein
MSPPTPFQAESGAVFARGNSNPRSATCSSVQSVPFHAQARESIPVAESRLKQLANVFRENDLWVVADLVVWSDCTIGSILATFFDRKKLPRISPPM